jgi:thymidylate kinase
VLDQLEQHLNAKGIEVSRGHWVPRKPGTKGGGSAEDPHGKPPRGQLASIAKLAYLAFRWWTGWFRGLREKSKHGVILFDRYHADLLADPRRYRYGGSLWLARLALGCLPQPDLVIFLDAPADVLLSRKQEVSRETLERSIRNYRELGEGTRGYRVIDASQPIDKVMFAVLHEVKGVVPGIFR